MTKPTENKILNGKFLALAYRFKNHEDTLCISNLEKAVRSYPKNIIDITLYPAYNEFCKKLFLLDDKNLADELDETLIGLSIDVYFNTLYRISELPDTEVVFR